MVSLWIVTYRSIASDRMVPTIKEQLQAAGKKYLIY